MQNANFSSIPSALLSFPPVFERHHAQFWSEATPAGDPPAVVELTGASLAMERLRLQIKRVGPHFRSALLIGEAGSGKGRVAEALHEAAAAAGRMVRCDMELLEEAAAGEAGRGSRLVDERLEQVLEAATRGTLYVERIGEASASAQDLLVRLLDRWERERREPGRHRGEIRLIASSREDLKVAVSIGAFRQDLYQRIAAVQMRIPSLRERSEDVGVLARQFVETFAREFGRPTRFLSADAADRLQRYSWPGNIRELENAMRGAVLASEGAVIEERDLPLFQQPERGGRPERKGSLEGVNGPNAESVKLQDVIDEHVQRVMRRCAGNKLRAAEVLGVSRSTLYRMLDAASAGVKAGAV